MIGWWKCTILTLGYGNSASTQIQNLSMGYIFCAGSFINRGWLGMTFHWSKKENFNYVFEWLYFLKYALGPISSCRFSKILLYCIPRQHWRSTEWSVLLNEREWSSRNLSPETVTLISVWMLYVTSAYLNRE